MDRRGFLKLFASAGVVAAVKPTYFFAPIGGWKSDVIEYPQEFVFAQDISDEPDYSKVSYAYLIQGGTRRYVHMTYALGVSLSSEMLDDHYRLLTGETKRELSWLN